MVDDIISFETARIAKENGFDLGANKFYSDVYGLCEPDEETLTVFKHPKTSKHEIIYDCNGEFDEGERFYAPTQSLLQKWLRETHKLHIELIAEPEITNEIVGEFYYRAFIWKEGSKKPKPSDDLGSQKYEVILEVALLYALNNI